MACIERPAATCRFPYRRGAATGPLLRFCDVGGRRQRKHWIRNRQGGGYLGVYSLVFLTGAGALPSRRHNCGMRDDRIISWRSVRAYQLPVYAEHGNVLQQVRLCVVGANYSGGISATSIRVRGRNFHRYRHWPAAVPQNQFLWCVDSSPDTVSFLCSLERSPGGWSGRWVLSDRGWFSDLVTL